MLALVRGPFIYICTLFHGVTLVNAEISFPSGLTVSWEGQPLGSLQLNDVNVVGNVGATIDTNSLFTVADVTYLTDFTKVRLRLIDILSSFSLCLGSSDGAVVRLGSYW